MGKGQGRSVHTTSVSCFSPQNGFILRLPPRDGDFPFTASLPKEQKDRRSQAERLKEGLLLVQH